MKIEYNVHAIRWIDEAAFAEIEIRPAPQDRPENVYCPRITLSMPITSHAAAPASQREQLLQQIQAAWPAEAVAQVFGALIQQAQRPATA